MKGKTKMKTATEATKTQQIIYDMLTTNTGSHMLDSGGDDDRHWQRNAKKTLDEFISEPYATIDPKYGDASISLFHYMSEYLVYEEGLTGGFLEFAKGFPEEPWRGVIEEWLDASGVEQEGEFYSDARWSFNTYNFELWRVNQTLQGSFFGMWGKTYLIVQVHGGADVRGGYTAPKVFQLKGFYGKDEFVLNAENISFRCPKCESMLEIEEYSARYTNPMNEPLDLDSVDEMPVCKCGGEWVA
jgi:hypothetical protein